VKHSDELRSEWIAIAPAWIKEAREGRNPTRNGLLDPPILEACGDVVGLRVLDCGCGEGRFCRLLSERGAAYVLGLDLCEPMIAAARELQSDRDEYKVQDVQDLGFLEDGSFDLAVSYLNQCDLPDFTANTKEVFRVLKKGGRFVVANLHPMRSATGTWYWGPNGERLHVTVDNYFDEGERRWRMMGVPFTNFHRTLSAYINTFIATGFILEGIVEPTLASDRIAPYPELADELRVPNFIVYILRKP
jgi:SAM-dependent methyltransferase